MLDCRKCVVCTRYLPFIYSSVLCNWSTCFWKNLRNWLKIQNTFKHHVLQESQPALLSFHWCTSSVNQLILLPCSLNVRINVVSTIKRSANFCVWTCSSLHIVTHRLANVRLLQTFSRIWLLVQFMTISDNNAGGQVEMRSRLTFVNFEWIMQLTQKSTFCLNYKYLRFWKQTCSHANTCTVVCEPIAGLDCRLL